MIESEQSPDRVIVLHPRLGRQNSNAEYELEEAIGLSEALGVDLMDAQIVPVREIHVANFFGGGKISDLNAQIKSQKIDIVIVNAALSPIQQRNLERSWKVKVVDRTGLILEIFGLRAATKEGRLQVELARLAYERSRLVRTWTHLERQRGGQGFLAGPGETQIESDRRVLNDKMTKLRRDLEQVRRTRQLQRRNRQRAPERVVALVGYTNAGKSTLFNQLTQSGVVAADMLFATLDTTHRVLPLPNGKAALLSDTVGFIADLPTDLITSFRATLEEVKEADLLIHVRDISDGMTEQHKQNVLDVLTQIKAGPEFGQNLIEVMNKADKLSPEEKAVFGENQLRDSDTGETSPEEELPAFLISAKTGEGLDTLLIGIENALSAQDDIIQVAIAPEDFKVRAWLHQHGHVLEEKTEKSGLCHMQVQLNPADYGKFTNRHSELLTRHS